jgi:hypothetical protein
MFDHADLALQEQKTLRGELQQLKSCQLQYFTLTVTGTGGILGLSSLRQEPSMQVLSVIAPLAIILPCWWIFFDKATTITRIIGYYRLLERIVVPRGPIPYCFVGYETALAIYRRADDEKVHKERECLEFKKCA